MSQSSAILTLHRRTGGDTKGREESKQAIAKADTPLSSVGVLPGLQEG